MIFTFKSLTATALLHGFFLLLSLQHVSAATLVGRVVALSDGDTVTVLDANSFQHKIRLSGIDAPERKQAFASRSKELLSQLVFNQPVTVEYEKFDRYGRAVGKILVRGVDANLQLVKEGMAWHYKKYQKEQSPADRVVYARAEDFARSKRLGLWIDPSPIPPWEFRAIKRDQR